MPRKYQRKITKALSESKQNKRKLNIKGIWFEENDQVQLIQERISFKTVPLKSISIKEAWKEGLQERFKIIFSEFENSLITSAVLEIELTESFAESLKKWKGKRLTLTSRLKEFPTTYVALTHDSQLSRSLVELR